MSFEDIPPAIRIKRSWCVHRKDGERPKVPHDPGGYKMTWSIPACWVTFEAAKTAYLKGLDLSEGHKCRFDGLGFFISREKDAKLDIYAVDLDHCRNIETGEIDQWAKDVLERLDSYSEVSPSGTGVHIFVKGVLPEGSKNTNDQMKDKNRIEVFVNKHHITITGDRLKEYSDKIEDRTEIIESIYKEVMQVKEEKRKSKSKKKSRVILDVKAEAQKKYVAAAVEDELSTLRSTSEGNRNNQLNLSAFAIGQFVGGRHLSRSEAETLLRSAARRCGMTEKDGIEATIKSGLDSGELSPREIPDHEQEEFKPAALPKITVTPAQEAKQETKERPEKEKKGGEEEKESIASALVNLALKNCFEVWHTPDGEPYMTVPVNSHKEHYHISGKSTRLKTWMGRLARDLIGKTPSVSSIRDAINGIAGEALYDGKEYSLYIRKAEIDGKIYVDIGDAKWTVIEISKDGWQIVHNSEVKFKRSKNALPLPIPEKGGEIEDLKSLINAKSEENWVLILAWLTQAFWCRGPYAHLYLRGGQGTLKSSMMAILKAISDPSAAIKRRLPKAERDAAIAIGSESIPCFDNLSGIDDGLADLFCVASTGGVSTQRALFTDDEEAVIRIKSPIIANGIEDLGQRGDLLDRTIIIDLDPIEEAERKTEKEINGTVEENRAKLFGCLLDFTVRGLANIDSVNLEKPPRMADFAEWAYACMGEAGRKFLEAYAESRASSSRDLAELNRLPLAIHDFIMSRPEKKWKGSASKLLADLNYHVGILPGKEPEDWPRTPDKMGSELRRFSQALESRSIITRYGRSNGKRVIELEYRDTGKESDTEETPIKTIPLVTSASSDSTLRKEEKESNSIEGGEERENISVNRDFRETSGTCGTVALDSDSSKMACHSGGTEAVTPDRIKAAAMIEYGISGWVEPKKLAGKLKLPLDEVISWLDQNYIKTENGRGYTQKKER